MPDLKPEFQGDHPSGIFEVFTLNYRQVHTSGANRGLIIRVQTFVYFYYRMDSKQILAIGLLIHEYIWETLTGKV